ncbi:uncharacterized protein CIMG_09953 [Coccidioides immitis RS]|uniref:Uncharacterized protein n=1 Tax=Coccidioides immitis (strain RS) TaxID=246410 RepID=J3K0H3_COCIM|nr:uncharacterized protein CIMG_09953 [Coccidioides immitis RS]EAS27348.3 hypothetical protein CIMG_09953 [Coccidioides immitis RS]
MQQCDYLVWTTYKGQVNAWRMDPFNIAPIASTSLPVAFEYVYYIPTSDTLSDYLGRISLSCKFTEHVVEGTRIIPSMTKDHQIPVRVDAAKYDAMTKLLNVVLQVNSKPQSPGLQEWIKKHSTHAKLATAKFDTAAEDKNAEYHRVLDELIAQGKENLKNGEKAD